MGKRGGRAAKSVNHAVAAEERNIIWKACNGIFRPVKTQAGRDAEKAAARKGVRRDVRSGHAPHRTDQPRITRQQQRELADEMGYKPYEGPTNAKEPVFYKEGGHPPYISSDHTGHGVRPDADGRRSVPWKGADSPGDFGHNTRSGTYDPQYDDNGDIVFHRGRR